ncbi:MAG: MFS transporter [Clostridia bacterium]|nr:MFS transporter [Clostridia bacterium]
MNLIKRKRRRVPLKKRLLDNYHWIIAAVTLLMLFIYGGAANNFSSLHIIPVSEALGISRTTFSLIFSIKSIMSMLASYFSGAILKKFGFRATSSAFLLIAAVSYVALSLMNSYWVFVVCAFAMGSAASFCGTTGATNIISVWFHRHRGTVLGFVSAATGLGGSVMCIAQNAAMERFTWRGSFAFCAIACGIIFILVFSFLRNKPSDMGLEAYGEGEEITGKRKRISERAFPGMDMKTLHRAPSFYLMIVCTFLSCLGVYLAFNTVLPFLKDCGYSDAKAASLQSTMMLLFTGTKLLVGFFTDRVGAEKVNTTCVLFGAVSLFLLAASTGYGVASIAVILYTIAIPLVTITVPLLAFSLFGYSAQGQYTGVFISVIYAASFLSSPLSNLIHDTLGSYRPAYYLAAALLAIDLILYPILYKTAKRDNKKYTAAE